MLLELGMVFNAREHCWQLAAAALRDFHTTHGYLRIPAGFTTPDGVRLSGWWHKQRSGPGRLSARRRALLAPPMTPSSPTRPTDSDEDPTGEGEH
ncbi:MAG: hypothetical protein GEV11_00375 [Streptosporangiales bacterium]|nr:hypothetical protein [Streptosporangiales bacterium]